MTGLQQYKDACKLRARANKNITLLEERLRLAHDEHQAANSLVTDAGIKVRAELGIGNFKIPGSSNILVITPTVVQIQELKCVDSLK